jgi:hypothetical protein
MPLGINLAPIPNQTLSVTIAQVLYELRFFLVANIMCCDLSINSIPVLSAMRLVAGSFIIPYNYIQNGNFIITTLNDELPYFDKFGASQFLIFLTNAEVAAIQAIE